MPLDKKKLFTRLVKEDKSSGDYEYKPGVEPPQCGICGKRITVAELSRGQFEAIQGKGGHMAYYHTTCIRMEAGGND